MRKKASTSDCYDDWLLAGVENSQLSDLYGSQAINYLSKTVIEVDAKNGKDVVYISDELGLEGVPGHHVT